MNLNTLFTLALKGKTQKNSMEGIALGSPFWVFVFANKINRSYGRIILVSIAIQFIIFKLLYPYPDFISDSYSYMATNIYNMKVNLWPIGYSRFLQAVHFFSHSDTLLVGIQLALLEAALAYFFYSVLYLFQPGKRNARLLLIFLFFNPMFIYLSNCVLSDALFTSLSLAYLTQLLWMMQRPSLSQAVIQGVIVGLAFTIRYTAIYYPLISIVGLLLSKNTPLVKAVGMVIGPACIVPFYIYTSQATRSVTGTSQFSVFGGWQLANNALYMYDHIVVNPNELPSGATELDNMTKDFYKKIPPVYRDFAPFPGTYFIKVPFAVLKPYMNSKYTFDDPPGQFLAWGKVSPLYEAYGKQLIKTHPFAFVKYYLWLNTKNYFFPHLEKFGSYNVGRDSVQWEAQEWFDYPSLEINVASVTLQGKIFRIFPFTFALINLLYMLLLGYFIFTDRFSRMGQPLKSALVLSGLYLFVNFGFSIFATPVVLRYQVIPMILLVSFICLMWEHLSKPDPLYS